MHGKLQYWKGWVKVKVDGEKLTFTGYRHTEDNAMQDASMRDVLYYIGMMMCSTGLFIDLLLKTRTMGTVSRYHTQMT